MRKPIEPNDESSPRTEELAEATTRREGDVFDRLLGAVAHDLSNLTMAIWASVETLRSLEAQRPDETGKTVAVEELDRIERAASQASSLMKALAAFRRDEADPTRHDLGALVENAAQLLRRSLFLEVDLVPADGSIPEQSVLADLAQLVRALVHLCARTAAEGGHVRIATVRGREFTIELVGPESGASNVVPLAPDLDQAEKILAGCESALTVTSGDDSRGWIGSIRLPAAPASTFAIPDSEASAKVQRGRALVAEGHALMRVAIVDALSRCGFSVEAVGDGDAFVDRGLAEAERHDVMLVDFDVPGRNAAKALQALREAGIEAPALMIYGNAESRSQVEHLSNTEFLQKPFGLGEIQNWATQKLPAKRTEEGER